MQPTQPNQDRLRRGQIETELQRHDLGTFTDELQSGRGVFVPGCPACRKRFNASHQFVDHLANYALPAAIAKLDEPYQKLLHNPP